MENQLQLFTNKLFGNVRAIVIDGKVMFVGVDVATALGYAKPNNAINTHCRATLKQGITDSLGRTQEMSVITEHDVIRLIMKSRLPQAEEFEKWVIEEVIPSVLATGSYDINKPTLRQLKGEALIDILESTDVQSKVLAVGRYGDLCKQEIKEELAPVIEYHDNVLNSKRLMTITSVAKDLSMSAVKLNKMMCDLKIQYKKGKTYFLYAKYEHLVPTHFDYVINEFGQQLRVTETGRKWLIELLEDKGLKAA